MINKIKNNKSLWHTIRLRFYTLIATFTVMWFVTGSPMNGLAITGVQQGVSFGVTYWFENKEENKSKEEPPKIVLTDDHRKYGVDNF